MEDENVDESSDENKEDPKPCKPMEDENVDESSDENKEDPKPFQPMEEENVDESSDVNKEDPKPCQPMEAENVDESSDENKEDPKPCKPMEDENVDESSDVNKEDPKPFQPMEEENVDESSDVNKGDPKPCQPIEAENVDESSDENKEDPKPCQPAESLERCGRRVAAAKAEVKVTQSVKTMKVVESDDDSDNTTGSDEDDDYSNESSSDETSIDEDSEWEFKKVHSSTTRSRRQPSKSGKSKLVPCLERQNMEINFRSKFYGLNKFPGLHVNISDWVPEEPILSNYLRDIDSIQFKISDFSEKINNSEELRRLKMFEGELMKGSHVMFCGGPVCAMAWCPQETGDQVLAVVAKMDFNSTMVNEKGGSRGLIQIWKIGDQKDVCQKAPTFQFGLLHEYGQVWGVEWCPSGGRGENRLGLLAAACSDGTVRVWAIPSLDMMQDQGMIYQKEADLSLVLDQEEEEVGQCLSMSWYRGPGHNHIADMVGTCRECHQPLSLPWGGGQSQVPGYWGQ